MSTKSDIARRVREGLTHVSRLRQPSDRPRVMIFIENFLPGQACDLRGAAVGRALRDLGWRVTVVPGQLGLDQRQRLVRLERPSVILLQQTRHRLNHPRFYAGIPCILDVDDADIADPLISDGIIDCARQCQGIIVGNNWLAKAFRQYNDDVTVVWTGSYLLPSQRATLPADRAPIVTWAPSNPFAFPLEAKLLRTVLLKLAARTSFEFWLYGAHIQWQAEAHLEPLQKAGVKTRTLWPMGYSDFIRSLDDVAIGLNPICMETPLSSGKSFGKLLAYMAAQVAVVTSSELEIPLFFRQGSSAALIENNDIDSWVTSIHELLMQPRKRQSFVEAATVDYMQHLTTARAAEQVDLVLRRVISTTDRSIPDAIRS
jgi:hypothetical protein